MVVRNFLVLLLVLGVAACSKDADKPVDTLDSIAIDYVELGLEWGEVDTGYVDAYYGPAQWQQTAKTAFEQSSCKVSIQGCIEDYKSRADALIKSLQNVDGADPLRESRRAYLLAQLSAMRSRMDMRSGSTLKFDEESNALYGAKAPRRDAAYFQGVLKEINDSLPGDGSLSQRVNDFREKFVIPKDRLSRVFDAAIAECQKRTQAYIELPESERFQVEYVTDKPWSGYNWYQGDYYSVIQVNTDLPIFIDRAVDLGCHEGYPGHHTYNVLLEQTLVKQRGWQEFTMYPLFSPQSLIAEGSANYGIDMAFPGEQRLEFEKAVLFPLAGLKVEHADRYFRLRGLLKQLGYAGNEAARQYLNGDWSEQRAQQWLIDYALNSPERATQRIRFFDTYRSYVINYNLGQDMVAKYVTGQVGDGDETDRWRVFAELLASPRLPSDLLSDLNP